MKAEFEEFRKLIIEGLAEENIQGKVEELEVEVEKLKAKIEGCCGKDLKEELKPVIKEILQEETEETHQQMQILEKEVEQWMSFLLSLITERERLVAELFEQLSAADEQRERLAAEQRERLALIEERLAALKEPLLAIEALCFFYITAPLMQ